VPAAPLAAAVAVAVAASLHSVASPRLRSWQSHLRLSLIVFLSHVLLQIRVALPVGAFLADLLGGVGSTSSFLPLPEASAVGLVSGAFPVLAELNRRGAVARGVTGVEAMELESCDSPEPSKSDRFDEERHRASAITFVTSTRHRGKIR